MPWVKLIKDNQKQSKFALVLVSEQVEDSVFVIVVDLFDIRYFVVLIQIEVELVPQIVVNAIILRCNNRHRLVIIHQKELRLSEQWHVKLHQGRHLLLHEVQYEYLVLPGKYQLRGIMTRLG